MNKLLPLAAALTLAGLSGAAAVAQNRDAASLRASGQVGEDGSGYMMCRMSCDAAVRSAVDAINAQRTPLYEAAARETRTTVAAAGQASFRARLSCANVPANTCIRSGDWYRPLGGSWTRK